MAAFVESKNVLLVSSQGDSFEVPIEIANMSKVVNEMVNNADQSDEAQEIIVPEVPSAILSKVIEFLTHYKSEPMNEINKVQFDNE